MKNIINPFSSYPKRMTISILNLVLLVTIMKQTTSFMVHNRLVLSSKTTTTTSTLYGVVKGKRKRETNMNNNRVNQSNELMDWAKSVGIKIGGVSISSSSPSSKNDADSNDLGVFANQNLNTNDIVIDVPNAMSLSVISPDDDSSNPDISELLGSAEDKSFYSDAPWFVKLSIILNALDKNLLEEKSREMRPWLDALPRSFNTPLHWHEEDAPVALEELQYPFLVESITRQKKLWKEEYYDNHLQFWNRLGGVSYEDFVWGCECARSRAFSGSFTGNAFSPLPFVYVLLFVTIYVGLNLGTLEQAANGAAVVICGTILKDFVLPKFLSKNNKASKRYTICPMIDMCNHIGVNESGNVAFEYFKNSYSLTISQKQALPTNKQLYISYGPRSNDQLLQYYGFVEQENIHDVYVMPPLRSWDIDLLEEACGRTFSLDRIDLLDREGLLGPVEENDYNNSNDDDDDGSGSGVSSAILQGGVVITRYGGIDPAIMQALRVLVSSNEEWISAKEDIGAFSQEFSPQNEQCVQKVAYTAMLQELEGKPTTLEKDEVIRQNLTIGTNKSSSDSAALELAILFRMEKKKLLKKVMNTLL